MVVTSAWTESRLCSVHDEGHVVALVSVTMDSVKLSDRMNGCGLGLCVYLVMASLWHAMLSTSLKLYCPMKTFII